MPTEGKAKWPKPRDPDEFEDIVLDVLKVRWNDPHASLNGRNGQSQKGVDIVGSALPNPPGAQCKNTTSSDLKQLLDEVEAARSFQPPLSEYLFVTAAPRDAHLQEAVRLHLVANPEPFPVILVFWDDLIHEMNGQTWFFRKHWPTLARDHPHESAPVRSPDLRRIALSVSMTMCVRPNWSDVDEFVVFAIENRSQEPFDLTSIPALRWMATDHRGCDVAHVSDGLPGEPGWAAGSTKDHSRFECAMEPRGEIEAGHVRHAGFAVVRKGIVTVIPTGMTLHDPYLLTSRDQPTEVSLVLPGAATINALGAAAVTSRSATWRFNSLGPGAPTNVFATWIHDATDARDRVDERVSRLLAARACQRLGTVPPSHLKLTAPPDDIEEALREAQGA